MASGLKVFSRDFGEQPGCGPDPDFRACWARPGQQGGFNPASGPRFRSATAISVCCRRSAVISSAQRRPIRGTSSSSRVSILVLPAVFIAAGDE